MGLIPNRWREQLFPISGYLVETIDGFSAGVEGLWSPEHNPDGSHKDISADTVKIGGSAVPITALYTPMLADVSNTTTETVFLSFYVPASKMKDGDSIDISVFSTVRNDTGSGKALLVDMAWGSSEGDLGSVTLGKNTSDKYQLTTFKLIRSGNTLWGGAGGEGSSNADFMSAVTFSTRQLIQLKGTLPSASASFYVKPQIAQIIHTSGLGA